MYTVYKFVELAFPKIFNSKNITEDIVVFLTPYVANCSTFCCIRGKNLPNPQKHNEQIVILLLWKFIKPMTRMYGKTQTDLQSKEPTVKQNKIENRKYNTFSH
jgi:hypothetical protein